MNNSSSYRAPALEATITENPKFLPKLSTWDWIAIKIRTYFLKSLVKTFLAIIRLPGLRDTSVWPTYTKVYPCRPYLTHRVFIPKTYKDGDQLLPLYVDIHGGGFIICDAETDDKFCTNFANTNNFLVVSLEYSLAPGTKFPGPVNELFDVINAVLEDELLPFDKTKTAVGGFSAGGGLALAVCQAASLRKRIGAVVGLYATIDWTRDVKDQIASKPQNSPPDMLENNMSTFVHGYFPPGQDLRDPLASVVFAARENLPKNVCLIGCEMDLLCEDGEIMAKRLAGVDASQSSELTWEKNGVRWEKITGKCHGYDMTSAKGAEGKLNAQRAKKMHDELAEWLLREVYK
ncbi:alpha beta hydrolase fold protein [Phlyctema vagabunda]|uniref:Alpha beta hydrolase fold protein n=1 Tax=Phlyctema vagabunda TaxID=108571 RepID=A0ABR4PK75_9HELO